MSDSPIQFNLNPEENKSLTFEKESKQFFNQSKEDVVFQKGKAVKSKVMSSAIFNNTIKQYGADGAKTIILQELINMSEDEIIDELKILAVTAEENNDIKRSLRAAKFLAIQWMEDPKRSQEIRTKCEFIIQSIPTFKISGNQISKPEKEEVKEKTEPARVVQEVVNNDFELADVKNKPKPPDNPVEPPLSNSAAINKIVRGDKLLIITDVQGDYNRLREALLKYAVVHYKDGILKWNAASKTKLVLVGDLFNKSPYSTWGGQVAYQSFLVVELVRRLIGEAGNNIFLSLGNYDLILCSGQLFKDQLYGFSSDANGIRAQGQAIPVIMSYLEGTAFDTPDNVYSIWEREFSPQRELFFKLKADFTIGGRPDIRVRANEMNLPDISSIRGFLQSLYNELTLPRDKRPKSIAELDEKAKTFLNPKAGENLDALLDSKERACFFEGILKGSKTISFLRRFISSLHKFQTDKMENLNVSHVSLQNDTAVMFEKAKASNWVIPEFSKLLSESKFIKMKKIAPDKFFDDLQKAGIRNVHDFITDDPERIFENLSAKNMLDPFVPSISPNKVKFGFVKGIERLQDGLKQEDPTGLLGFRLVDRKQEKDFSDVEMKKIAELNKSAKQAYADKVITDLFGNNKGFDIKVSDDKVLVCEKFSCKLTVDIDKSAALYEDENKAIHVPIKHIAYLNFV